MTTRFATKFLHSSLLFTLALTCFTGVAMGAGTNIVDASAATNADDALHSSLQIQEQIHNLQLSEEKDRADAEAAAVQNSKLVNDRLEQIEQAMASQHQERRESLDEMKKTNQYSEGLIIGVGVLGAICLLALLSSLLLLRNVIDRVAAMAAKMPGTAFASNQIAFGTGDEKLLSISTADQSATQLLGIIERLEKRVLQMESGVAHPALPESAPANGSPVNGSHEAANGAGYTTHQLPAETNGTSHPSVTSENHDAITVLLGKGQTLLRLDKPDAAIMCFDEVLAIDAKNTDALVKKGAALERLQKLDEAIDCFDRAIAADSAMTMAYLYKGGVFNRMERYAEALECYERALRTQEKNRSANVIIE